MTDNLKQKTIKGVAWNTVGNISNQILQLGISVILMRLLKPSDYGLLAMAMVLVGFANIFSEFGFSSALIQKQDISEDHVSSVFWLNIIIGIFLTNLFFFSAGFFSEFFGNPGLTRVIKYLSFTFIISSFSIVPNTLLQKEMQYDIINKISITAVFVSGVIGVYLAFAGWGVMSLVIQNLSLQLITVPLLFLGSKWLPKRLIRIKSIKELFSFSAYLTGFNFINYWARKSDDLLVGKYMGAGNLGIYSRAYDLMLLPISKIISLISNVMFPALSAIQEDRERVKRIYLQTIQLISFVTFPLMIGLIPVADNLILVLFGNKWAEVIPIIRILAFVGVLQTLANPTGWIYTSQGKTNWMFWWGIFGSGSIIIAIVIGVLFGSIHSVAIAYLSINLILVYPVVAIPGKLINMKFIEVFKKVFPILLVSVIMAVIVYFLGIILPSQIARSLILLIQIGIGAMIYIMIMWYFKIDAFNKITALFKEQYSVYKNR